MFAQFVLLRNYGRSTNMEKELYLSQITSIFDSSYSTLIPHRTYSN